jgi:hypothetical protein
MFRQETPYRPLQNTWPAVEEGRVDPLAHLRNKNEQLEEELVLLRKETRNKHVANSLSQIGQTQELEALRARGEELADLLDKEKARHACTLDLSQRLGHELDALKGHLELMKERVQQAEMGATDRYFQSRMDGLIGLD